MPKIRFEYVAGLTQLTKGPLSNLQTKELFALFDVKVNVAFWIVVDTSGPPVIVVWGPVRSITQVKLAGVGSVLPFVSVARTRKLWLPAVRPDYVVGLVQPAKATLSRLQAKVLLTLVD